MHKFIVLALGLVLLAAACNKPAETNNNTNPPPAVTPPASNPTPPATPPAASDNTEIKITSTGFEPSTVTIKKGSTITFKNNDTQAHWPASAPHPSHTDYPQFDPKKGIVAGASWSFTFDKVGTWKFHDHLNATKFGSVTVTE